MKWILILVFATVMMACGDPRVKMVAQFMGGEPELDGEEVEVPFSIGGSHIINLTARFNDRDIPIVLDTGGMTILDSALADSMKLELVEIPDESVHLAKVDVVALDGASVHGLKAAVMDFSGMFGMSKFGLGGMIGSDWLRHFQTTFDYERGSVMFRQPEKLRAKLPNDHLLDMTIVMPYFPTVETVFNGDVTLKGIIDTGLHYGFVLPMAQLDNMPPEQREKAIDAEGWFAKWPFPGPNRNKLAVVDEIRLGDIVLNNVPVIFADLPSFTGDDRLLIGKYFLDDYITTLDYEHEQVLLREAPGMSQSIVFSVGLNLTHKGDEWKVCGLWQGCPAQRAGIQLDDIVLAINGTPVAELTRHEVDRWLVDPEVKSIELRVRGADGERTMLLEKEELL
ncbi:MAG: PDZ domain-containing protein [Candidatus Cloacimonetes bacterium]|nr:PDZ domain-containing protein [Candidatus Cloacimonadota bacterium]